MTGVFLDERRLLSGPWRAFERDVARAFYFAGFEDVRLVGGSGDRGGDVVGVKKGRVWVVQCKFTSGSLPPRAAVTEVTEASRYYGADELAVATSRPPSPALWNEIERVGALGFKVHLLGPRQLLELSRSVPHFPPRRRQLRDYQEDAATRLYDALQETGRGQIVFATGLGKTVVMAEVATRLLESGSLKHNRVLVLADKVELIRQLQFGFWSQLPKTVPTHMLTGEEVPSFWDGVTFATVQSAEGRADDLPEFDAVFVDEAHHVGSPTFRNVLERIAPPRLAGVTATPWRGDGFEIDTLLGAPLVRIGIADGLAREFLCDVDYRLLADNIDWDFVHERSEYGYTLTQLNKRLIIPTRDDEAARSVATVFRKEGRKAGLVFSPSVAHAEAFASTLRLYDLASECMHGALSGRERDKLMSRFKKGAIDILCTVDLFNEGVDVPDVDLIVFMRATHSRRIFVQQLGRGLRVSPLKDKVIVLDYVTDLRRVAEVVVLERAVGENRPMEYLPLGRHLVSFADRSAGSMLVEWIKDQADLMLREGDPTLELPTFNFPEDQPRGSAQ